MKKIIISTLLLAASGASYAESSAMKLTSTDIKQGTELEKQFTQNGSGCNGNDISPQLSWSGEPAGTKSFAVTVYDPDAPTGSGWWHWTIVNIPASVHSLARDAGNRNGKNIPAGAVQGRTDFGNPGYGGACPPSGDQTHRYHYKVWALKTASLPVTADSSGAVVGYMLGVNQLASAEIIANYTRP